ncbi:phage major capsid protein [Roseomonas sp. USHLN139]|uniref:phage major capsid protein n=1 Tax=Roseomonas sp. USHLN139 TaxID=3081298 RepID=UPI003B011557
MRSKALRAQRAKLIEDARALISAEDAGDEAFAQSEVMMAEASKLMTRITALEAADREAAELAQIHGAAAEQHNRSADEQAEAMAREKRILTAVLRGAVRTLSPEDQQHYRDGLAGRGINGVAATTPNSAGGYTIAPEYAREMLVTLKAFGGVREAARVLSTANGTTIPWPTNDDTANRARIIGENAEITADNDLVFGQVNIGSYKYATGVLKVSVELLQDSAFDFDALIRNAMMTRFARGLNADMTTGAGTAGPQGVVTGAAVGATGATGATVTVAPDSLIDLQHSIDPAVRNNGRWMLHDTTLAGLRKLKDAEGRYIWQQGVLVGEPDTLFGKPITVNQDMPVPAANAKSILFGNFGSYMIRDVMSVQMMVLRERYAEFAQVGYLAYMRSDGRYITANAEVKAYRHSAT